MKIKNIENQKLAVYTEYNSEFIARVKEIGGKWNHHEFAWFVDYENKDALRQICLEIFGTDGTTDNTVKVKLTALDDLASWGSYKIAGKILVRVWDRDSGARPGDGVILLSGKINSGGSRKNYSAQIDKGSVFRLSLSRDRLSEINPDEWKYEIIEKEDDARAKLLAEKEALEKRLAEINNLLN